jgi:transcriptional regulator with XRE-family HTH domain
MNGFGDRVRSRRIELGITLRRFADMLGVSPTYVSGFEKGALASPTPERIRAIAEILQTDSGELISLGSRWNDAMAEDAKHRPEIIALYRAVQSLPPDQLQQLTKKAEEMSRVNRDD